MRKFYIPYIPYQSLLLSTTLLNDISKCSLESIEYNYAGCKMQEYYASEQKFPSGR